MILFMIVFYFLQFPYVELMSRAKLPYIFNITLNKVLGVQELFTAALHDLVSSFFDFF